MACQTMCLSLTRSFTASSLRRYAGVVSRTAPRRLVAQRTQLHAKMTLVSTTAKPEYDVYVKGSPEKGELGDCPFSHRTMLTLEEKGIPYNKMLLDENAMPEWVKEVCEGKQQIPFITELSTGKWSYDSDKIVPMLEEKYPEPKLGMPDQVPQVGMGLMPAFMEFLTSKGAEQPEKEKALVEELRQVNEAIGASDGPYIGGKSVNAADLQLAPKLKHVMIGSNEIKGWKIPTEFSNIPKYMDAMSQRQSWKNTYYTEQYVRDGWNVKMQKMGAQ